ncbi:MAG: hypothetical protein Q4C87_11090 [Actinomycetaceae bacterium]|nr:hypothetical protein [Actinomycetaceae bacterium]
MLVVVLAMGSVTVAIVDVIHVIAVLYSLVTAAFAMLVLFFSVLCDRFMFIIVIAVERVVVSAVNIVHMVAVLDCFVATAFAMLVVSNGVFGVDIFFSHESVLQ